MVLSEQNVLLQLSALITQLAHFRQQDPDFARQRLAKVIQIPSNAMHNTIVSPCVPIPIEIPHDALGWCTFPVRLSRRHRRVVSR